MRVLLRRRRLWQTPPRDLGDKLGCLAKIWMFQPLTWAPQPWLIPPPIVWQTDADPWVPGRSAKLKTTNIEAEKRTFMD